MVNFIEQIYFQDASDVEVLEDLIYKWTPLKTERKTKVVNGTEYPVLKVYWDEDYGMHNWCPNDDWTYPSKEYVKSIGRTQPNFFEDILPEWENKFEFERFETPRKTQKEIEEEKANIKAFEDAEKLAISNAEQYILFCGNHTDGGYKECIRDAFCPLVLKFKPKNPMNAIEKYKEKLFKYIVDMPFSEIMQSGITQGLESVFLRQGW